MPYLLGLLLALAAAALIAWPMLRSRRASPLPRRSALDELIEVRRRRNLVYDDIQTLRLDQELGHVTADQYSEAFESHRLRAALLLRQEEEIMAELAPRMNEIEDEVLAFRQKSGSVLITAECEECGRLQDANAPLCPQCETDGIGLAGPGTEAE